ncbi:hypothetical protein OIO90_003459 [Microbotryomycetes sp. JL221]|nr:hypothetical protein OIO90_003459 [Microbotryomycetes sp. JL221]
MSIASPSTSSVFDAGTPHPAASLLMSLKAADRGTMGAVAPTFGAGNAVQPPSTTASAAAAAAASSSLSPSQPIPAPATSNSRAPKGDLVEFTGEDRCGSCCRAGKPVCVALMKNGNRRRTCSQCQRDKKACDKFEKYDSDGKLITKQLQATPTHLNTATASNGATAAIGPSANTSSSSSSAITKMSPSPRVGPLPLVSGSPVMKPTTAAIATNVNSVTGGPATAATLSPAYPPAASPNTASSTATVHLAPSPSHIGSNGAAASYPQLAPPPPTHSYAQQQQQSQQQQQQPQQQQQQHQQPPAAIGPPHASPYHYHLWHPAAAAKALSPGNHASTPLPPFQQVVQQQPPTLPHTTSYHGSTSSSAAASPPPATPHGRSVSEVERHRSQLLGEVCDAMLSVLNRWSADEREFSGPRAFVKRVTQECGTALRRPELLDRSKVNDIVRKLESALKDRQQALGGDEVADQVMEEQTSGGDNADEPVAKRRRVSSDASGRGSVPSKRSLSIEDAETKPRPPFVEDEERDELESNE